MNNLSKMIFCRECEFAIYIKHDIFTGKERYHCGKGVCRLDEWGNEWLFTDDYGGCEFGKRKSPPQLQLQERQSTEAQHL
jgi:hypothetical protein